MSNAHSGAGPVVVLVGVPGAGKTTVGTELAGRLGVGFRDTDTDVELQTGKSVADIFLTDGEETFRALERDAVSKALAEHDGVLALGGGAILDEGTRTLLAPVPTVWLQVSPESSSTRVGMGVSRPVLLGNVRGQLIQLMRERAPLYEQVASATVATDDQTPEQVAQAVIDALALPTADGAPE